MSETGADQDGWWGSPHRRASWGLASLNFASLILAAWLWTTFLSGRWTILSMTAVVITFLVLVASGYYRVNMYDNGQWQLRLASSAAAAGVAAALFVVSLPGLGQPSSIAFVSLMAVLTAAATSSRLLGRSLLEIAWRRGHLRSSVLVLGYDEVTRELAVEVGVRRSRGVDVVGFLTDADAEPHPSLPQPVFSIGQGTNRSETIACISQALAATGADRLIIGPNGSVSDQVAQIAARWAGARGLPVHVVPRLHEMGFGLDSTSPDRVRGYPLVRMQRSAHPRLSMKLKRFFDLATAGSVVLVCAPVLLIAALAVRLSGPGDILFRQERIGQGGRPITIYKFRSMTTGDGDREWNADARITRAGAWLRRSNIDELPQLFSVLKGDMSLVGPRPERPAFVEEFSRTIPDYGDRHRLPVGLTGLSQVIGLRGDTPIPERVKYDNLYIDQWCLRADFEILAQTVTAVLFQSRRNSQVLELHTALASVAEEPVCRERSQQARPAEVAIGAP